MKAKTETPAPAATPRPLVTNALRFRIEKLEERIAPKKGGQGTHKCLTGNCASDSYGGSGY